MRIGLYLRFNDNTGAFEAVYTDDKWFVEGHYTQKFALVYSWSGIKKRHVIQVGDLISGFITRGIDSEVCHSERSQILEEVCALTRFDTVVRQG